MMRRRLDLPEPFTPNTPILAPGKNESEMSFRITRLGGTILPTRFMLYTYCAIFPPAREDKGCDYRIGGRHLSRASVESDEGDPQAALACRDCNCSAIWSLSSSCFLWVAPEGRLVCPAC